MTRPLPSLLAAAALASALPACGGKERAALPADTGAAAAIGVRAVKPRQGAASLTRATGELRARHEATLSPETTGRIARILVDVGDRVRKGEPLLELDPSTARIGVEQARAARAMAEAALKNATTEHRRMVEMAKGEAASAAMLDRATAGLEQAQAAAQQAAAALLAAEDQLAKHTLRAPFDAVITSRLKSPGEVATMMPPTPVLGLVDVGSLEVRAAVPETVVDLLQPGATVDCTVSPSGKAFKAKIRAIGAVVEPGTRTVDVRADVTGEKPRELRPGAIVEVSLGTAATATGLFLPADTVQQGEHESFVWTVQADTLKRKTVQIERLGPGLVRVVSGVGADELVVAEAGAGLADGARVRVLQ
jgi:RND family efflux transporter MFP subunit